MEHPTTEEEETKKKTGKKVRLCKRKRVSMETMQHVSEDTWILVCSQLFFSPHCVFRLMRASKRIWLALKDNIPWWETFYQRIVRYQVCLFTENDDKRDSTLISGMNRTSCYTATT